MMKFYLVLFIFMILSSSCGENARKNHSLIQDINFLNQNKIYRAVLEPINDENISGSATVSIEEHEIHIHTRLINGPVESLIKQEIYLGDRCPNIDDDKNLDGQLDNNEIKELNQKIIIPLDDDINSQRMGSGIYPLSDDHGQYRWTRTADKMKLKKDLYDFDLNPKDQLGKLSKNEILDFENKSIILKNINNDDFPIVCGIFKVLSQSPGKIDDNKEVFNLDELFLGQ